MTKSNLLQRLSAVPVLGVSLANVRLLRLDLTGGRAPGNKSFKLQRNIDAARRAGLSRMVSFGGAWSNHIHALAAVGAEQGLETVGIIRGERSDTPTPMLRDAERWGMQLIHVSRQEYRRRGDDDYLAELQQRFSPCLILPEGGANPEGVKGCIDIAALLSDLTEASTIILPVGTGTTLAGVAAGLEQGGELVGIAALKGALDLEARVLEALASVGAKDVLPWRIEHGYHCGGYARSNSELRQFVLEFERIQQVALDPVYTAKTLFAVYQMLQSGALAPDRDVVVIHTGGLQGRRGAVWL